MGGAEGEAAGGELAVGGFEVGGFGGELAPGGELGLDEVEEGELEFGEVGGFGGPVVHLDVDVGVIVGVPGGFVGVVPEALEVGGDFAGGGDEEVAAELEEEGFEFGVGGFGGGGFAFVGGECALGVGGGAEVEGDAVEEGVVVGEVVGEAGVVGFLLGVGEVGGDARVRGVAAVVAREVHDVVGAGRDEDGEGVAVGEGEFVAVGLEGAAVVIGEECGFVVEVVGEGAGDGEGIVGGGGFGFVGVGEIDGAGIAGGFVGGEAEDEEIVGVAGEEFAGVVDSVGRVGDVGEGVEDVEVAAVVGELGVVGEGDGEVGESLVGAEGFVVAGGVGVAGPEGAFVEEEVFVGGIAADHGAEAAVADAEGVVHGGFGGVGVPEGECGVGGWCGEGGGGEEEEDGNCPQMATNCHEWTF